MFRLFRLILHKLFAKFYKTMQILYYVWRR